MSLSVLNRPSVRFAAFAAVAVGAIIITSGAALAETAADPTIAGFYETVSLPEADMSFTAKMDTGADTSSVNAKIVKIIGPDDGEQLVTFQVINDGQLSEPITKDITKYQILNPRGDCVDEIRRPKVMMDFDIGGRIVTAEVSLADRSDLSTDLLIGRNVMNPLNLIISPNPADHYSISEKIVKSSESTSAVVASNQNMPQP